MTLVPEQFSYEFEKKLYQQLGVSAFNQLETYSFRSLSRTIFQRLGSIHSETTYADELTKYALLHQAVITVSEREHLLRILGKQCRHVSFLSELEALFVQFRRNGITPDRLYASCASLHGRLLEKTLDLFEIYHVYDRLLIEHQLKDTETELTEAAAIANGQDAFLGKILYMDEFDMFTVDEYEMLEVLLASCKEIYIALRTEDTEQMPFSIFSTVNETMYQIRRMASELHLAVQVERCDTPYRFHAEDLTWLSRHILRQPVSSPYPMQHLHVLEAETPNEEVDFVCTTIRRLLANHPTLHCRDIAILTNQLDAYQSVLETTMERYDLPYHLDDKSTVSYTPLMVYLQTLSEILRQRKPDTELLLRLGKSELTACTMTEISQLEEYCYTWQIDGDTWNVPFTGGDFTSAELIRQKLTTPIITLRHTCRGEHTGARFCEILYRFVQEQKIEEKLNQQLLNVEDDNVRIQITEEWAFAWNSWIEILDHMSELYDAFPMQLTEFCSILSSLLQRVERTTAPRTLDAVLISEGSKARLNAPKIVFLLGVCDGVFPAFPSSSAIFSERDCKTLEQMELPVIQPKETLLADARLNAYKLLSAASDALYLLYPCVDITHQKCYPSSVVSQIRRMFPMGSNAPQTCEAYGSAYYATTMPAAYYRFIRDYTAHTADTCSIERVLLADSFYRERLRSLEQISRRNAVDADAPLFQVENTQLLRQYIGDTLHLSASGLERYQLCPFSYFCQDVLRLKTRTRIRLAGANRGSLIHYCLEQLLRSSTREEFLAMSVDTLFQKACCYAQQFWAKFMGGDFSKSGRELAAYDHTVDGMRQMIAHLQEELQQSAFYPHYFELMITPDNYEFPPLTLRGTLGQSIALIGKVDRVDLCQDGDHTWVRVVDYKTGSKDFAFGDLLYGMDMQMLVYLFTIISPHTALSGAEPAGVLYMPAGKIQSNRPRGDVLSAKKQYYDTYRMKGVLLRDPHVLTLMEADGKGLYIPGKLDASQKIDEKSGLFLSQTQMNQLRKYVLSVLQQMSDQLYSGVIDANPLVISSSDSCAFCAYANICGNADHHHERCAEGSPGTREKQMLKQLEREGEEH